MAHFGTLRDYHFNDVDEATDDVRGSKVYGPDDEKLGKIDDVIFDHSTGQHSVCGHRYRRLALQQEVCGASARPYDRRSITRMTSGRPHAGSDRELPAV